ncbi:MAG: hypothetical protein ABW221_12580 [Vicinamibacteria bacterium]
MNRSNPTLCLALALTVPFAAGCQTQRAAEEKKSAELERRLAELERQASPSPSLEAAGSVDPADAPALPDDRPAPATAAPRDPAPAPLPALVLTEGAKLTLRFENAVSSETSRAGDAVTARVESATDPAGRVVLPGGTVLRGRVVDARQAGRVKGRARVSVDFDRIVVRGRTHALDASAITVEAADDHGRDAKIVGGSAAAGAIIGAIKDGKEGFAKGALIGGAGGTGAVLLTRGRDIQIPAGARYTVTVKDTVRL